MGRVSYDFSDETVVVTGGSSGIGRAIALRFGGAGATVLNADLDPEPKDEDADTPTHERIEEDGGAAAYVETDVSDVEELADVIDLAGEYGGVDVMVNNAGWFFRSDFLDVTAEEFDRIHEINARGVFFGTQLAALDMVERGTRGAVVNTASISSTRAQARQVPYDSTKGAIRMITRGTALELAEHGIRVNAIAPGHVATEFGSGAEQKKATVANDGLVKPVPLGRAGVPGDLTGAVLFLASEDADYVTGEFVHIDGGWRLF